MGRRAGSGRPPPPPQPPRLGDLRRRCGRRSRRLRQAHVRRLRLSHTNTFCSSRRSSSINSGDSRDSHCMGEMGRMDRVWECSGGARHRSTPPPAVAGGRQRQVVVGANLHAALAARAVLVASVGLAWLAMGSVMVRVLVGVLVAVVSRPLRAAVGPVGKGALRAALLLASVRFQRRTLPSRRRWRCG